MSRVKKVGLALVLVALAGLAFWFWLRETPAERARALYWQARRMAAERHWEDADALVRQAIELDGQANAAYLLAAECAMAREDFERALEDLSSIDDPQSEEWLPARRQAAELLHYRICRLREAEAVYREILSIVPDDISANDGYARMLALCGRWADAVPHVLSLIRAGHDTDLLILLSRESGALNDPELLEKARRADPSDPNPLLGKARAEISTQNSAEALELLRSAASMDGLPHDFHGKLGQQLLANRRFEELDDWVDSFHHSPKSFESWLVLAKLAERRELVPGAIRCYWEAVRIRPESLEANNRLAYLLASEDRPDEADLFHRRVQQINEFRNRQARTIMSNEQPELADIIEMVQGYRDVGRLWEAFAWGRFALGAAPGNDALRRILSSLETELSGLPLELTARRFNPAYEVDLSDYPVPSAQSESPRPIAGSVSGNIAFDIRRDEVGFDFTYFDGTPGTTYRMFELAGGGIAVLDYDQDGAPDLFLTQGRNWRNSGDEDDGDHGHHDRLFHNRGGTAFVEVAESAGLSLETGFGQGAAAGDFNNDGFADLYVANTGKNALWLNNGDGTFSEDSKALADRVAAWTTSCLIADLNQDSYPDLYDVNYLTGDNLFDRLCVEDDGGVTQCGPKEFEPALDRVWLSDGAGGFFDATNTFLASPPLGKGLGILAMDAGDGRLSVFVANDTTANFFYRLNSSRSMRDDAVLSGLAFNRAGKAEGCMGIAVGDCNMDGRLDLLVTNFLHESNTLYSQTSEVLFEDRTVDYQLAEATQPMLGFGTQFLDANLDGRLEAFIANGFTHDASKYGIPYAMPPQVFEWTGHSFQELPAEQLGPWSTAKSVGRAVARLDWNRDGKPDLAVGLLDRASYLLENRSRTQDNRSITLRLIATQSARDAIGARVTAEFPSSRSVHQLTAGDGYQCSNERTIVIGCGAFPALERLSVVWPSGGTQHFSDVETSRSFVLVEGENLLEIP